MKSFRPGLSRICLALSWIVSATGFAMLCDCPGFYVVSALLALVTVVFGDGRLKSWGVVALLLAVTILAFQLRNSVQSTRHLKAMRELSRQTAEAQTRAATNGPPH